MLKTMTRRSFSFSAATLAAAGLSTRGRIFAQDSVVPPMLTQYRAAAAKAKIESIPLRGGVCALVGSGGNIGVLPGKDGLFAVDSGFGTSRPQLEAAMKALGGAPLSLLVNTHWHFDHTDGNEWMHAAGATIMATEKTKERLGSTQIIAAFQMTLPPSPAGALPSKTFHAAMPLKLNDAQIMLQPYAPAHTDTDTWVYFADADVLHVGDTWFNRAYPFIDYSSGGSIDGMIAATEKNLAFATAKTIIIPGHGPMGDKAQLQGFHEMLTSCRGSVTALKKQGKTLQETVAAKPTAAFDAVYGQKPESFVALVYQGV